MESSINIIDETIEEKLSKIKGNEGMIVRCQDENAHLSIEVATLSAVKAAILKREQKDHTNGTPVLPEVGRYSTMSLTPAVLDVIARFGSPPGLSAPAICQHLKTEGFVPKTKEFYNSVYSVAMRASSDEKIKLGKDKDDKRTFMRKEPF